MTKTDKYRVALISLLTLLLVFIIATIGNGFLHQEKQRSTNVDVVSSPLNVDSNVQLGNNDSRGFVFTNSNYDKNIDRNIPVVSVYLSLGDRKSSDFLMFNSKPLLHYLSNNKIILNIVPLPDKHSYSSLFFVGLAKYLKENPKTQGDSIMNMLFTGAKHSYDMNNKLIDEQKKFISNLLGKKKGDESLFDTKNAKLFYDYGNNTFVQQHKVLPIVVVSGSPLSDNVNINNVDELYSNIFTSNNR